MDQAILVASHHPLNLDSIQKWCEGEKRSECFDEFREGLKYEKL